MPRTMLLDSHQITHLEPAANSPIVPLRGRPDFKRQAPAKNRAIERRQQREVKASITGQANFSARYGICS